jgi:hypothetical protein
MTIPSILIAFEEYVIRKQKNISRELKDNKILLKSILSRQEGGAAGIVPDLDGVPDFPLNDYEGFASLDTKLGDKDFKRGLVRVFHILQLTANTIK